jgi:hypothetical protein
MPEGTTAIRYSFSFISSGTPIIKRNLLIALINCCHLRPILRICGEDPVVKANTLAFETACYIIRTTID